jgi:hypothetical protein
VKWRKCWLSREVNEGRSGLHFQAPSHSRRSVSSVTSRRHIESHGEECDSEHVSRSLTAHQEYRTLRYCQAATSL